MECGLASGISRLLSFCSGFTGTHSSIYNSCARQSKITLNEGGENALGLLVPRSRGTSFIKHLKASQGDVTDDAKREEEGHVHVQPVYCVPDLMLKQFCPTFYMPLTPSDDVL